MFFPLVKIDVAAHVLNRSVRQIFDLVDGGTHVEVGLMWVFNLAVNPAGYRRELRFWCPEIEARRAGQPAKYHNRDVAWVISQILPGNRQSFQPGQINDLLQVRHNTRLEYGTQLPGIRHSCGNTYQRPALERFLALRWLGNYMVQSVNPALAHCKTVSRAKIGAPETELAGFVPQPEIAQETAQGGICAGSVAVSQTGGSGAFLKSPFQQPVKRVLNGVKAMCGNDQANNLTAP